MTRRAAVLSLAVKVNWAHRSRMSLLAILVGVGMTVFLIVTELSRVSSIGLDDAIAEDLGETGTYAVHVGSDLGLSVRQLAEEVGAALAPFSYRPPSLVEVLPQVQPECPPYRELGPQQILVLRDGHGEPAALPFGENLPEGSQFCIEGQQIPASALYIPTPGQQEVLGVGIFVESTYRQVVLSATTLPVAFRFVVVTNRSSDEAAAITDAVSRRLGDHALRHGVLGQVVTVSRLESADGVRRASEGIKTVYFVIAWGVLVLGGLGLLVAELIVVRERTWFYGLARAVGAHSRHIVALVLTDVLLVLLAGTGLGLLLTAALQPAASSLARSAFAVDVELIQPSSVPRLMLGGLLVLVLAGVYPALKATRQDPLDVLEPKSL